MSFKKEPMKNYMSQVDNYQSPRSLVFREDKWVKPSTTSSSSSDEG